MHFPRRRRRKFRKGEEPRKELIKGHGAVRKDRGQDLNEIILHLKN